MKNDIREAMRFLSTNPGFAAVIVLTLGLAIGVNSTIFSVLNGVLLRPLAYGEPEQLVGIWETNHPRESTVHRLRLRPIWIGAHGPAPSPALGSFDTAATR